MKIGITSLVDLESSAHNRLHQFIKYLSKNHDITIICINDWWKKEQSTEEDGYLKDTLNSVEIKYFTDKKISPVIQEVLSPFFIGKLDNIDIHLNYGGLISGYFVSKKLKSKNIPTIFDVADDNIGMIRNSPQIPTFLRKFGSTLGTYMLKKNINIARKVTVTTIELKKTCKIPDEKMVLIPNGVDINLFKDCGKDKKEELGLDGFVIGYVGVLREWVNLEPVFMALKDLDEEIKMVVVGKEGRFEENVDLAKRCGVSDRITFTGMIAYSKVPQYISAMDVCLIPFKANAVSENALPLKLFEYMACEKPVISTELPGIKDIAKDKVLYASNSEEYKEKITMLYEDDDLRRKIGNEGRKFVEGGYDWEKIAERIEKVLLTAGGAK